MFHLEGTVTANIADRTGITLNINGVNCNIWWCSQKNIHECFFRLRHIGLHKGEKFFRKTEANGEKNR